MKKHKQSNPLAKGSDAISNSKRPKYLTALACGLTLILAACAQQSDPSYYEQSRASTETDARHRAQGSGSLIAPSQLQIGFGQTQKTGLEESPVAHKNLPTNLRDTRTYLGTFECLTNSDCKVQRMTLTITPDGQWRARNSALPNGADQFSMGCWAITNNDPIRINLDTTENTFATLEFSQVNVLRLVRISGQVPVLQSHLTRQADIDPIQELSGQPAIDCN